MTRGKFMVCLLAAVLVWTATLPAQARRDLRAPRSESAQRGGISLDEAVARVRRDTGGRVLAADARDERGRTVYRIKVLLPNGSVRVVSVDAQAGATR